MKSFSIPLFALVVLTLVSTVSCQKEETLLGEVQTLNSQPSAARFNPGNGPLFGPVLWFFGTPMPFGGCSQPCGYCHTETTSSDYLPARNSNEALGYGGFTEDNQLNFVLDMSTVNRAYLAEMLATRTLKVSQDTEIPSEIIAGVCEVSQKPYDGQAVVMPAGDHQIVVLNQAGEVVDGPINPDDVVNARILWLCLPPFGWPCIGIKVEIYVRF